MQLESIGHSLWFCKSLKLIRKTWSHSFGFTAPTSGSLCDFLTVCKNQVDDQDFAMLLILLWRLWFCRNHFVHQGMLLDAGDCYGWARSFAADFQNAVLASSRMPVPMQHWQPPGDSFLKLNSDAATSVKSNKVGLGVVVRNHLGQVLLSAASSLSSCFSPLLHEALALKRGLELARDASLSRLVLESDCATLVKSINSNQLPLSEVNKLS
ncbi:hypothetical protein ACOSQ3_024526 [Xanthoceras sorbifolium]